MKVKKCTKKSKCNSTENSSKKLVVMGALLACTAFDSGFVLPVYGKAFPSFTVNSFLQQQETARQFNIPAGSLDKVFAAFQDTTGIKIQGINEALRSLTSSGVTGSYSLDEALKQILVGTNVTYRFTSANEITITIEATSEVIEVTDSIKILNSPKFTEPLRDTPQSISIVSKETLEDQGVTTLRDALRNVAGVSIAAGEGGNQGDNLTIRGFGARNDLFIDGMRDFGNYYRDPFNVEQVEVLKGPSSVTLGRGSTGGAVNQTYKAPQLRSFINGTLEFGSDETKRATIDINEPISKLGKNSAFRLNILGHYAQVAERDIAETRRYGFAPSLAIGIGQPTNLTISYFHQSSDDIPDYGLPYLFNGPAPVDRNNYYGFKNSNFLKTNVDIGTIKFEHQFNDSFGIRNQARYTNYSREALITAPRISGTPTLNTPLNQIQVSRNQVSLDTDETFLQNQFDVTAKFQTGFIKYTVVGGVEGSRETSKPTRFTITGVPLANLLNPNTETPFSGTSALTSRIRAIGNTFATYFLTTINLADKLEFVGGVRYDRFDVDFEQFIGTAKGKFNRLDNMTSYRGAIVYKPMKTGSIYFSYSTSFNPSAEAFALSAATVKVAPEENRTFEVGSKWDLLSERFSIRAAAFRVEKTNARETDPMNSLLVILSGEQKVDGFEFETTGRIMDRLQINSSYAFLDSELVASKFFPKAIGSRLTNVPKHTGSLTTTYNLPWRLDAGFTLRYVGSRNASSTTPLDPITGLVRQVKSYTVADMFVKRAISESIELQINAYNLSNKFYIDQVSGGHLVPGAGRSVKVGLNFKLRK
ncbi:MAG: TonB-dependent siderophore receptor [Acidobacteria bacterium]|nr:TonB-dependent siderophore receptor [Acidobacteriota bacterium]